MDRFNTQFNNEVIKDVLKFNEEIEKEKENPNPDPQKLQDLYMKQIWRGMQINTGYIRDFKTLY